MSLQDITQELLKLEEEGKIIVEEQAILFALSLLFRKRACHKYTEVLEQTEYAEQFPESEFLLALGSLEERLSVQYAPSQKEAIQTALMSPITHINRWSRNRKNDCYKRDCRTIC